MSDLGRPRSRRFGPMLRVTREACEDRDGVQWFDGQPVTGAIATTDWDGSPAGRVVFEEFRDGLRVGPWHEPVVDLSVSPVWNEDCADKELSDFHFGQVEQEGWLARFETHGGLSSLLESPVSARDSGHDGHAIYFGFDGGVWQWNGPLNIDTGQHHLEATWGWSDEGELLAASLTFKSANQPSIVGSVHTDKGGLVNEAGVSAGFFELVQRYKIADQLDDPQVLGWLPIDSTEVAGREWAPAVAVNIRGLSDSFVRQVIELKAPLAGVEDLKIAVRGIDEATLLELVVNLPALRRLEVRGPLRDGTDDAKTDTRLYDALVEIWRQRRDLELSLGNLHFRTRSNQQELYRDDGLTSERSQHRYSVAVYKDDLTDLVGFEEIGDPTLLIHAATSSTSLEFASIFGDRYRIDTVQDSHPTAEIHHAPPPNHGRSDAFVTWINRPR